MRFHFIPLFLAANVDIVLAGDGVDLKVPASKNRWKCIKNRGCDFAIVQISDPWGGDLDRSAPRTINNARAAGIKRVDGYISPITVGTQKKGQVKAALDHLRKNGAKVDQLWLDVGVQINLWDRSKSANVELIQELVEDVKKENIPVGIHTKRSQWKTITGDSDKFKSLPLWYVHHDDKANFTDFKSFAGWTKPTVKQYKGFGVTNVCEVTVNKDWYP